RPPERGSGTALPQREEQAFGVNVDPAEGNLAKATHDEARSRVPGAELDVSAALDEQAPERAPAREGELTRWLLFLVLAFLLLAADAATDVREGPVQFQDAPPSWMLVLLLAALVLVVRAIYRRERQKVSRPWRVLLGGLRIVAIALVALALFQPQREQSRTV